jgi:hypothetical protein
MTFKTRLFGLIIFGLLILPIFLSTPERTGQVLGASETTDEPNRNTNPIDLFGGNNTETLQSNPKETKIGEIGSGVRAKREKEQVTQTLEISGQAILDSNTVIPVSSDKFPLGTSIQVKTNTTTLDLVVQGKSILSTNTLLVLDSKTFELLGGDSELGTIQITVKENE